MNPDIYAEWLRRQSHTVIRTESSYWFDQGPRVYQAFPYHWVIRPPDAELHSLLRGSRAIGARYSCPTDQQEGSISYHIICSNKDYDLKNVDRSVRHQVRRGLESCKVLPISFEQYAEEGWKIQCDTDQRQGRGQSYALGKWKDMILSAADLSGFEVWGALVGDRLAATLFFVQVDDWVDLLYQQSLHEFLPQRVNNAITFVVTQTLIKKPSVNSIHYGLHSLTAPASVDKFKIRMGYSVHPVRQRVVLHPALPRLLVPSLNTIVRMSTKLFPKSNVLAKTNGFLNFYTNGLLPIGDQQLSELLVPLRDKLIPGHPPPKNHLK